MPRTVDEILAHAEDLTTRFEDYEPQPGDELDVDDVDGGRRPAGCARMTTPAPSDRRSR